MSFAIIAAGPKPAKVPVSIPDRILKRWETFAKDDAELIASGLSGRTIDEQSEGDRAGEERQVPADQTRKVQT